MPLLKNQNLEQSKNINPLEKSLKQLSVFCEAGINIIDVCIDLAHRVSRNDDTAIIHFTTFCRRYMFHRKRKKLKNEGKVDLDLT